MPISIHGSKVCLKSTSLPLKLKTQQFWWEFLHSDHRWRKQHLICRIARPWRKINGLVQHSVVLWECNFTTSHAAKFHATHWYHSFLEPKLLRSDLLKSIHERSRHLWTILLQSRWSLLDESVKKFLRQVFCSANKVFEISFSMRLLRRSFFQLLRWKTFRQRLLF